MVFCSDGPIHCALLPTHPWVHLGHQKSLFAKLVDKFRKFRVLTPSPLLIEELVQKIGFDLSPSLKVYEDGDDDNDKDMKTPLMKKRRRKVIKGPKEV